MKLKHKFVSFRRSSSFTRPAVTYLFIADGKLALRLLVCLGKCLKLLDGLSLGHMKTEFHICLGIFMAGLEDEAVSRHVGELRRRAINVRKPWYHQAKQPVSDSKPCASPRHYPRRIVRILGKIRISGYHSMRRSWSRTANEESISGKNDALVTILHEVADAVLRVTWGVQSADSDPVTNLEFLAMRRRFRDGLTVASSNDGEFAELPQL
jgi:hypothetical protein